MSRCLRAFKRTTDQMAGREPKAAFASAGNRAGAEVELQVR